jgi:serine O-acetyltransferase
VARGGRRPGFDAYGTPAEGVLDPLLRDIESLRAELSELECRVAKVLPPAPASEPENTRVGG